MTTEGHKHYENIRVKRGRYAKAGDPMTHTGNDYFAISMSPREEDYKPYEVALSRYCVPGRIDIYRFDWAHTPNGGNHVRFSSEERSAARPLSTCLAMLQADLDKPRVVKMLVEAVTPEKHMHYARQLVDNLLKTLAPRSKAYRACKRAYDAMYAARLARFEAEREAEIGCRIARLLIRS